jgi:hypothetical protein
VLSRVLRFGDEGIAKRKGSPYRSGCSPDSGRADFPHPALRLWLKSKNPACAAVKRGVSGTERGASQGPARASAAAWACGKLVAGFGRLEGLCSA